MTANNVTYAVFGDAMHYWDFFPHRRPAAVVVPLWGFAEVVRVAAPTGVDRRPGLRLPADGSHLVVEPGRVDERGFRDASAHRRDLPVALQRPTR